ncbi:MAG: hypothetical protein D8M58_04730 [Calditrichaeota bacterium]|nr:MAG: hypothetical protein DWQ03_02345 [Calditrichota bacterium]MBL1204677.1 hypothetical protein [Calditrichota bacterium]NOG44505.1 hypothetical protein [Calditrichota bacterium]
MDNFLKTPFKLQALHQLIEQKAKERNAEIGSDFFSLSGIDYSYVDSTIYETYELMTFVCPKSKSTISIKIIEKSKK